jgi:hypothetical protein
MIQVPKTEDKKNDELNVNFKQEEGENTSKNKESG